MTNNNIAILLSTFNGEHYLEQQIQSIVEQDFKNWDLYIRDDGSSDSTIQIIQRFCEEYPNIRFLQHNHRNKGSALSFLHLLHCVEADYFMFCDQDDFWFKDKITTIYNILLENDHVPALVFSDAKVADQDLNIIDESLWNYNKMPPDLLLSNPKFAAVYNCAPGCTMIFNKRLKKHLLDYDSKTIMHDWYVLIKALDNGVVRYSDRALMLYRQHNNNVLGADRISVINLFRKIIRVKKSFESQKDLFIFVRKYMSINLFNFYILKLKFNFLRFKKR